MKSGSCHVQAEQKATRFLVIILVVLHAALALTFKVLFFSYYVVETIGGKDPLGESPETTTSVLARYIVNSG